MFHGGGMKNHKAYEVFKMDDKNRDLATIIIVAFCKMELSL